MCIRDRKVPQSIAMRHTPDIDDEHKVDINEGESHMLRPKRSDNLLHPPPQIPGFNQTALLRTNSREQHLFLSPPEKGFRIKELNPGSQATSPKNELLSTNQLKVRNHPKTLAGIGDRLNSGHVNSTGVNSPGTAGLSNGHGASSGTLPALKPSKWRSQEKIVNRLFESNPRMLRDTAATRLIFEETPKFNPK
eukprot:TRINITY_DN21994_c0_g1_i2.p1 TRINITY_DN21994_c0_g1~~TRINITY_DN21994_c0_g1_i2.p1  ORF type:complete len:193 (-),score=28.63 TRINITY_DN21994_c0_g1_i2:148-726(-)